MGGGGGGGGGGKGGGGGSKAHDYYGTIAGAVCTGPVEALVQLICDGKEVWPKAKGWNSSDAIALNALRNAGGKTWLAKVAHTASDANKPPNATYWDEYFLAAGASNFADLSVESYGAVRIYWGTPNQTVDPKLQAAGNDKGEAHPDYKGICYIVLKDFLFGRERTSAPNLEAVVRRKTQQSVVSGGGTDVLTDGQINMMAMAAEVLTHSNGLGLAPPTLDNFQTAANALEAKQKLTGCSPLLDDQQTFREFWADLALLTDAFLRYNPQTKKIEAGVFTHGVAPASYTTLTTDDLTERPRFRAEGWSAVNTRAVIVFTDRTRGYKQSSDKIDDLRAYRVLGEHRPITLQRPYITRRNQAMKHAVESLRTLARPQLKGTVSVRREKARTIRPGDWVLVDIDLEPGGTSLNQFFRVIERLIPRQGPIQLTLEADELINAATGDLNEVTDSEISIPVPAIVNARVIEAPVSLAKFETDHVIILAERPSQVVTGFQVFFDYDADGVFQVLGDTRGWATRAALRADHSDSTLTLQITVPAQVDADRLSDSVDEKQAADDTLLAILVEKDGTGQTKEDASEYAWLEVCSISAITLVSSGNYDLTVLRGRQQTKQRAFTAANAEVWIIRRKSLEHFHHGKFDDLRENRIMGSTPASGYFRLAPYTYDDSRDLADCTNIEFRFAKSSQAGPELTLTAPVSSVVNYPANWLLGHAYVANTDYVWNNNNAYQCKLNHTSNGGNQPGVGEAWPTYWQSVVVPYPIDINFAGQWTDPNEDMQAFQIAVKKDGGEEVIDDDDTFSPVGLYDFDEDVHIAESGTWRVRLIGYDTSGLKSSRTVTINARGATTKVAKPKFSWRGRKLDNEEWNLYGKIKLKCRTSGAAIQFRYKNVDDATASILWTGPWHDYVDDGGSPTEYPVGWQPKDNIRQVIEAKATKSGYADSDINTLTIKFKRIGNTDPAF